MENNANLRPNGPPPPPTDGRGLRVAGGGADWLQLAVIARVAARRLSSYRLSQMTGGAVSEDHIRAYLTRKKSMGSHKLQHVLRALGGLIVWRDPPSSPGVPPTPQPGGSGDARPSGGARPPRDGRGF